MQVQYRGLKKALKMQAASLVHPLLAEEAMSREILAIENEFQMVFADDNARMVQILQD